MGFIKIFLAVALGTLVGLLVFWALLFGVLEPPVSGLTFASRFAGPS